MNHLSFSIGFTDKEITHTHTQKYCVGNLSSHVSLLKHRATCCIVDTSINVGDLTRIHQKCSFLTAFSELVFV
jgi:hypothetical protein